jgi:uncharacterized protein YggE
MKKAVIIWFVMMSLLSMSYASFAQSPPVQERNLIYTEGVAEVLGQNDSAKISIAVVTDGKNLEQISAENARKTKEILKVIKRLNITGLKLKTSHYRVTPQKDYKARPPEIKGYEVYNAIEVTLESLEPEKLSTHCSKIVGQALESGANNIHTINFYIKNRASLEKEALTQATKEAIARAATLAQAAGVKLRRIATLSTHPIQPPPRPNRYRTALMESDAAEGAPPIEIGESQIRVQVSLAYEIE